MMAHDLVPEQIYNMLWKNIIRTELVDIGSRMGECTTLPHELSIPLLVFIFANFATLFNTNHYYVALQ